MALDFKLESHCTRNCHTKTKLFFDIFENTYINESRRV